MSPMFVLLTVLALSNQPRVATSVEGPPVALETAQPVPCFWWHGCDDSTEGLPPEAPRKGLVITIDTTNNVLYLFEDAKLQARGLAATGSEKSLRQGSKKWVFHTPHGQMKVLRKLKDPIWTKPDWAFVEVGEAVPPADSPKRQIKGHLGKYALDLGDGVMIHGTNDPKSIGKKVSHGCIRISAELLEKVYLSAKVGTTVYIY